MSDIPLAVRLQVANHGTLHEIMRETEAYLAAQLTAALAADLRAYTFAGTITAASVLLIGGAYALATVPKPDLFLVWLSAGVAACLFLAGWLAVMSARSVDFEFAGNQACNWIDDVESGKSLVHALAEQCAHYDGMASANTKTMRRNSLMFNWAVNIALSSVGIGGLVFMAWLANTLGGEG